MVMYMEQTHLNQWWR